MLVNNGGYVRARFLGGGVNAVQAMETHAARARIGNAMAFGNDTSWPQGYQSVIRARLPPLVESGQAAARLVIDLSLLAEPNGIAQAAASLAMDLAASAGANYLASAYATMSMSVSLTADAIGIAQASATLDWIARPSAGDIAQEVWNSFTIEGGFSGADVMRVLLAVAAGKTTIARTSPTVVTFRDTDDTKDRVRAEMIGSERDAVTIDGA